MTIPPRYPRETLQQGAVSGCRPTSVLYRGAVPPGCCIGVPSQQDAAPSVSDFCFKGGMGPEDVEEDGPHAQAKRVSSLCGQVARGCSPWPSYHAIVS